MVSLQSKYKYVFQPGGYIFLFDPPPGGGGGQKYGKKTGWRKKMIERG